MPCALVDGNDVHAVWRVVGEAVARARSGEGATLIEARTYRWRTHVESEESFLAAPYRNQEEVESWKQRDPISRREEVLVSEDLEKDVADIRGRDRKRVVKGKRGSVRVDIGGGSVLKKKKRTYATE